MEQFKKNAAVIVLGVIAAAMLIGNITKQPIKLIG